MKQSGWRWLGWRSPTTELRAWLTRAYARLAHLSEHAALEAQLLAAHVLEQPRAWVITHPETPLSPAELEHLDQLLERLAQREPLPYLLGRTEFFGLTFEVSPSVLIPRPETELLVEQALKWLRNHPRHRRALDVGTGSGVIAITLAVHIPDLTVIALDRSRKALEIAHKNIEAHQVSKRVELIQTDLVAGLTGPFDLVCANLPYIPSETLSGLEVIRYEPRLALDGGEDGLRLLERLMDQLSEGGVKTQPMGLALYEIEANQGEPALTLARRYFPDATIHVMTDLAGLPRLLVVEMNQQ